LTGEGQEKKKKKMKKAARGLRLQAAAEFACASCNSLRTTALTP